MPRDPEWSASLISLKDFQARGIRGLCDLELKIQVDDDIYSGVDLRDEILKPGITQGSLFAYMFRRFGFPNQASDPDQDLVCYVVSTPRQDMALRVTPHASQMRRLNFTFLVPVEAHTACRSWPWRHVHAQRERKKDWIADESRRPAWADDWVRECIEEGLLIVGAIDPKVGVTFRQTIDALHMNAHVRRNAEVRDERHVWLETMMAAYEKIEPEPGPEYRTKDWRSWPDDDPLKPYVEAAEATLRDLERPVRIRDTEITIYGEAETKYSDNAASGSDTAGLPFGMIANADPDLSGQLHRLIQSLGDGDLVAGMKAVIQKFDRIPSEG